MNCLYPLLMCLIAQSFLPRQFVATAIPESAFPQGSQDAIVCTVVDDTCAPVQAALVLITPQDGSKIREFSTDLFGVFTVMKEDLPHNSPFVIKITAPPCHIWVKTCANQDEFLSLTTIELLCGRAAGAGPVLP